MDDAPERIWVRSVGSGNGGQYSTRDMSDVGPCVEYIRADLAAPRVKPLVWWVADTGDFCCDTNVGRYQVAKSGSRFLCMYAMGLRRRPKVYERPTYHRSEQSAKSAAQADYERRILEPPK